MGFGRSAQASSWRGQEPLARLIYDVPGRLWRLRRRGGQGGFSAERAERKRRSAEAGPQSKGSAFSGGVLAARREVGGRVADGAWRMVDVECPVCHPCAHSFWPWVCGPAAFGQVVQVVQVVPVVVVVIVTGRLVERKGQNGFAASGNSRPGRGRGDCRRLRFKAIQSDSKIVGKTLKEIFESSRLEILVIGIEDREVFDIIPRGKQIVTVGMTIFLQGELSQISAFRQLAEGETSLADFPPPPQIS